MPIISAAAGPTQRRSDISPEPSFSRYRKRGD